MESYESKSDEVDADAERLADEGERVDRHIEEAKKDWEAKQGDSGVPGAVPEPDEDEEELTETQSEHGESAESAGQ